MVWYSYVLDIFPRLEPDVFDSYPVSEITQNQTLLFFMEWYNRRARTREFHSRVK